MRRIKKTKKKSQTSFRDILRRIIRLIYLFVFLTMAALVIYGFQSGYIQRKKETVENGFHETMQNAGFAVTDIFIDGRVRTPLSDIKKALHVRQGMPMTQVDMQEIFDNLTQLPWIKHVQIHRQLPNLLYVRLMEKNPIALWQKDGKHHPIDEDGRVIDTSADGLEYLVITVGDDAPEHAPELMNEIAKYKELARRTMSAVRIGGRRWNLILDHVTNGLIIELPEENISETLKRLDRLDEKHHLLNRQLSLIDLRLPDRLIVQTMDNKPIESFKPKNLLQKEPEQDV